MSELKEAMDIIMNHKSEKRIERAQRPSAAGCYLPGTMPEGWGLRRHVPGEIVVSHKDGSGVLIRENSESIAESLFYRMMDQILLGK